MRHKRERTDGLNSPLSLKRVHNKPNRLYTFVASFTAKQEINCGWAAKRFASLKCVYFCNKRKTLSSLDSTSGRPSDSKGTNPFTKTQAFSFEHCQRASFWPSVDWSAKSFSNWFQVKLSPSDERVYVRRRSGEQLSDAFVQLSNLGVIVRCCGKQ
jgi:hypothetical protein